MTARLRLRRNDTAGFTLLEALIATALMVVVLTALGTVAAQWLPNWRRGMAMVQGDEALALGLDRIVADLAAAEFVPLGRETLKPLFNGKSQSVIFVRTALSPNSAPGLDIVRFAEIDGDNGPMLVREQSPFVPVAEGVNYRDNLHFADPVVLIRPPYQVTFSYAGDDRVWRDTWEDAIQLPSAVRLRLRDTATGRVLTASTATSLHVGIPADCINAKSFAECLASRRPQAPSADAAIRG